jgi:hypothetical protein
MRFASYRPQHGVSDRSKTLGKEPKGGQQQPSEQPLVESRAGAKAVRSSLEYRFPSGRSRVAATCLDVESATSGALEPDETSGSEVYGSPPV